MEMKSASKKPWKHVLCCIVLLIIFVLTMSVRLNAKGYSNGELIDAPEVVPLRSNAIGLLASLNRSEEETVQLAEPVEEISTPITLAIQHNVIYYISIYEQELRFFADAFGVKYTDIVDDLIARDQASTQKFNPNNIGYVLDTEGNVANYLNAEYGIVEYFYDYVESNPKKVNKKRVPYLGDAQYVENLIVYYVTHIYTNVDPVVALSIGASESGYYKVKYMLKNNNVFGGMNANGLIKYKNIEYGVLSYIRLLSRSYYGKGLTTVKAIGQKYCPQYDNNGDKIASPHWVNLVTNAQKKYSKYSLDIELTTILESK